MKAYRVDRRDFHVDDNVNRTGEYFNKLNSKGIIVEKILEENRPSNKPKRDEVLHVFEKLEDARKFWSKMHNGKLYEVIFDDEKILHRGDMKITEYMYNNYGNTQTLNKMAEKYWKEEYTENPEIEILVISATITKILSKSEAERSEELRKRWDFPQLDM